MKNLITTGLALCVCVTVTQSMAAEARIAGVAHANEQDTYAFQQTTDGTKRPGSTKPRKGKTTGVTAGPGGNGW